MRTSVAPFRIGYMGWMRFCQTNFQKHQKNACNARVTTGKSPHSMRRLSTTRPDETDGNRRSSQTGKNGNQAELQVSKRPQFRASDVIAHALALYNLETTQTVSQTMNRALRQFLPAKYIAQAEQLLRNGKEPNSVKPRRVHTAKATFRVTSARDLRTISWNG